MAVIGPGSTGLDRRTGRLLTGLDHVCHCVEYIFATRIGSRVMLRWFGSGLPELLGRRATRRNLALYQTLIALGIRTWEPRLDVVRVTAAGTRPAELRLGELRFTVLCRYRPNALRGDFRVEGGLVRIGIGANDNFNRITVDRLAA